MKKAKFFTSADGEIILFAVLNDHLEGYRATHEERVKARKAGLTTYFKLYDDDDELYYSGYANLDALNENDDEFLPLDWAMGDSGCTRLDYRNPVTRKMETI